MKRYEQQQSVSVTSSNQQQNQTENQNKKSGQQMNRFNLSFMILVQIDPCPPEKMELPPELSEVRPSLVKDPGIINQYDFEALPDNADTELQVLSHTGDSVAACSFKIGRAHV